MPDSIHIQSHDSGKQPDGPIWDTTALQRDFTVEGFAAPFVVVRRKSDGQRGTLEFTHSPRYYFDFQPHHESMPKGGKDIG
jgi:hypothetical protein